MKTLKSLSIFLLMIGVSLPTFAQSGHHKNQRMNWHPQKQWVKELNLTKDQQKKAKQIKSTLMEETLPLRNKLRVKRAELHSLTTGKNADFDAAKNTIDEKAKLRADMAKKMLASKEQFRNLLTEDQRIKFDSKKARGNRNHFFGRKRHRQTR